jgi:hypothetical protein
VGEAVRGSEGRLGPARGLLLPCMGHSLEEVEVVGGAAAFVELGLDEFL